MGRPRSFDEAAVLDQAVELFWARGYEGTSMADLEEHLGMGRQSLYNTFGDKQDLFLKALERYAERGAAGPEARLTVPGAGLSALRAYFDEIVDIITRPGDRRACMVVQTIAERGASDPDSLTRCNRARRQTRGALLHALVGAQARGELAPGVDVEGAATMLLGQMYGLTLLGKAGTAAGELRAAVEALFRSIT
jgi:TetR/AcrR family transcriptional regulator, transcriptional repressor for nem operon